MFYFIILIAYLLQWQRAYHIGIFRCNGHRWVFGIGVLLPVLLCSTRAPPRCFLVVELFRAWNGWNVPPSDHLEAVQAQGTEAQHPLLRSLSSSMAHTSPCLPVYACQSAIRPSRGLTRLPTATQLPEYFDAASWEEAPEEGALAGALPLTVGNHVAPQRTRRMTFSDAWNNPVSAVSRRATATESNSPYPNSLCCSLAFVHHALLPFPYY